MKLLQRTGRYYFWFSTLIFVFSGLILFLAMRLVINHETDENLLDSKAVLAVQLAARDSLPEIMSILYDIIEIQPISTFTKHENFSDTLYWNAIESEYEPYRKYTYHDKIKGKPYRISVSQSKLDIEKMTTTIVLVVLGILVFLLIAINLFNRRLSLHLWQPFYQTIQQIKEFTFDKKRPLSPPQTEIEEFAILHQALEQMTTKVLNDYRSLKQFAENASHEIQTPLAIIKNKIELLTQKVDLNEKDGQALQDIHEAATRLSKLNQSLLLLTRIENRQFANPQLLNLAELINKKIDHLEPLIASKGLKIFLDLADITLVADPILIEILLNNLLGNAIKHNFQEGIIEVSLKQGHLSIHNTGKPLTVPSDELFERFRKGDNGVPSLGLGLAIVKEICIGNHFQLTYSNKKNWHQISIFF